MWGFVRAWLQARALRRAAAEHRKQQQADREAFLRIHAEREARVEAFREAVARCDTRAQHVTYAPLKQATNAELAALLGHRAPAAWRGARG